MMSRQAEEPKIWINGSSKIQKIWPSYRPEKYLVVAAGLPRPHMMPMMSRGNSTEMKLKLIKAT